MSAPPRHSDVSVGVISDLLSSARDVAVPQSSVVKQSCSPIERCFELQPLERRVLFAVAGDVLTKAIRQELLNHWTGSNKAYLRRS